MITKISKKLNTQTTFGMLLLIDHAR